MTNPDDSDPLLAEQLAYYRATKPGQLQIALAAAGFVIERMVEPDLRPLDPDDTESVRWGWSPAAVAVFPSTLIVRSRKP